MSKIYQHCVQMKLLIPFAGYVIGVEEESKGRQNEEEQMPSLIKSYVFSSQGTFISRFADAVM